MANFNLNIAKGRFVEFMNRVKLNDPANSAILLVPLSASDTEANTQDFDDLAAFLGGTPNEATAGGWSRKVLTDVELAAIAVDDVNNRFPATIPAVTWTAVTAGNDTTGLAICYDSDTTGGADSAIIVITHCDFVVETDGGDVVVNAGDYNRAS